MLKLIAIMSGGALGALMRYLVGGLVDNSSWPIPTLTVNMIGCLVIGMLLPITSRTVISPELHSLIFIGFLGAFTTFSTFALETTNLIKTNQWAPAIINILISNVGGILMVMLGFIIAKAFFHLMK